MGKTREVAYLVAADGQRFRLKKWDDRDSKRVGNPSHPTTLYEKNPDGGWEHLRSWETAKASHGYSTEFQSDDEMLTQALRWLETALGVDVQGIVLDEYRGSAQADMRNDYEVTTL